MSDESMKERICRACGQDCTGQPRIKDKRGRYLHKSCYEKAKAKASAKAAAVTDSEPAFDEGVDFGVSADMFGETASVHEATAPCPDCGQPTVPGTVICTSCGHNFITGQSGADAKITKPSKLAGAAESAASGAMSAAKSGAMGWALTIGIPLGVGLICSIAWAYAVFGLGYSIGLFLLVIGVLVGLALKFVGGEGFVGGMIAGAITLCSVGLGIVLMGNLYAGEDLFGGSSDPLAEYVTANDAKFYIADWIAYEREEAGETLNYPAGYDFYTAEYLEHFPKDVRDEADRRWAAMEAYEQHDTRAAAIFSSHDAKVQLADKIVSKCYERGEEVDWPNPQVLDVTYAYYPRDYPGDIWAEAEAEWDAMPVSTQQAHLTEGRRESVALYEEWAASFDAATSGFGGHLAYRFMRSLAGAVFIAFLIVFKDW